MAGNDGSYVTAETEELVGVCEGCECVRLMEGTARDEETYDDDEDPDSIDRLEEAMTGSISPRAS